MPVLMKENKSKDENSSAQLDDREYYTSEPSESRKLNSLRSSRQEVRSRAQSSTSHHSLSSKRNGTDDEDPLLKTIKAQQSADQQTSNDEGSLHGKSSSPRQLHH